MSTEGRRFVQCHSNWLSRGGNPWYYCSLSSNELGKSAGGGEGGTHIN